MDFVKREMEKEILLNIKFIVDQMVHKEQNSYPRGQIHKARIPFIPIRPENNDMIPERLGNHAEKNSGFFDFFKQFHNQIDVLLLCQHDFCSFMVKLKYFF